ncbi:MAG: hypothetical protein ACYDC8_10510 [Gammaproteobacteria bacterium]
MTGSAFPDVIAKVVADPAFPADLKQKVQAGYLPCHGVWLQRSECRAYARRKTLRRYIVTLELLILLAAVVGLALLTWAFLRLLCCS